ncbi:three-Cys-motif partner protein TcmP [Ktedonospora formicarum]|uniref:Three-Cys-motif partner protein TcmP n=1 Tax=Ktedonospora formicarum TaxID=2778364 RepID=A0A8J3IAN7_9CHLR|nr:three-Cys-motif partner protein TcmP [Ktedonospora formicarum]GHO49147.1 hypothetical protein KSX_73100 [Ktedonospora formicarum]
MHAPRTTIWKTTPVTHTKHVILRLYLEYWLPKALQEHEHIRVLEGFAGPGEYIGGAPGSPLITLETYIKSLSQVQQAGRAHLLAIDIDPRRTFHLNTLLENRQAQYAMTQKLNFRVIHGDFTTIMNRQLHQVEQKGSTPPPTFAFIDPFGFSDTPMSVIARILQYPHTEILFTFMGEEINRFLSHPQKNIQQHFDALFGTEHWRDISSAKNRAYRLCQLYQTQLQIAAKMTYTCAFCLKNKRKATDYFLIFGTANREHFIQMKRILWTLDPYYGNTYYGTSSYVAPLLPPEPDYAKLTRQLVQELPSLTMSLQELDEYILTRTPFYGTEYRPHILKYLKRYPHLHIHELE